MDILLDGRDRLHLYRDDVVSIPGAVRTWCNKRGFVTRQVTESDAAMFQRCRICKENARGQEEVEGAPGPAWNANL